MHVVHWNMHHSVFYVIPFVWKWKGDIYTFCSTWKLCGRIYIGWRWRVSQRDGGRDLITFSTAWMFFQGHILLLKQKAIFFFTFTNEKEKFHLVKENSCREHWVFFYFVTFLNVFSTLLSKWKILSSVSLVYHPLYLSAHPTVLVSTCYRLNMGNWRALRIFSLSSVYPL